VSELILHHYATSPFSEKVRLVLGMKGMRWRSVTVPAIMPKPDVVALTGGYRRTPVLQVGADIYCDTALICRTIEQLAPQPTLFPPAAAALQQIVAQWADTALFWSAVPYTTQPAGMAHLFGDSSPDHLKALAADRAAMTAGMKRPTAADATAQLRSYLSWLASLFADGRPFLLGPEPCIADFSAVHPLWFIRLAPALAGILESHGALLAWYDRVTGFGHGKPEPLTSGEAIAIAAAATGHATAEVAPGLGFERGAPVTVCATDYASDLVPGTLVGLSTGEVVIERRDDRAGLVHVHFPRIGYQIKKAS
jgi:glutathione S-transferase